MNAGITTPALFDADAGSAEDGAPLTSFALPLNWTFPPQRCAVCNDWVDQADAVGVIGFDQTRNDAPTELGWAHKKHR